MRERAELIGGVLTISPRAPGGILVWLEVPREKAEAHGA
jgi:nitrate/nitrite-specific signal transduction histidine kinase